ncbi:alpha/beta hydrolase [soil metagenome]
MNAATASLNALGIVAPPIASEIAFRLWSSLGTPDRLAERDRATHEHATRGQIDVRGKAVTTYRWGDGPRLVVLVHGWRSRASRFAPIVERLRDPMTRIVAFDAPGNGDSPGDFVTIDEYVDAIRTITAEHGPADTIIGHSFGALSAMVAVREGVRANRLVSIAGIADADQMITIVAREANLTRSTVRGLRRRIERRVFTDQIDPWRRYVAEINPADVHVPLLLVADSGDPRVPLENLQRMAEAHTGEVSRLITTGWGHNRILRAPEVVDAVGDFVER